VSYYWILAISFMFILVVSLFSIGVGVVSADGGDDDDNGNDDSDDERDDDNSGSGNGDSDEDRDDDNSGRGNSDDEVRQGEIDYDDDSVEGEMRSGSGESERAVFRERERFRYVDANGIQREIRYEYRMDEDGEIRERLRIRIVDSDEDIEIEIEDELEIEEEIENNRTRLKVKFSNGQGSEIRIMPDVAAERALERLRLRVCSEENNCSIILKDVGQRDSDTGTEEFDREFENKAVYELKIERKSRVLGVIPAMMTVRAEVNAESGEIENVSKPWWAAFAAEPEEI